jgi:hypothetical protein
VELEGLTGCQLHGLIAKGAADGVHLNPLLGGRYSTIQSASDHERVSRLKSLGIALVAEIAIVLHVCAVELGQLLIGSRNGTSRGVKKTLRNSAPKEIRFDLDVFVRYSIRVISIKFEFTVSI